jgi:hemoglobin
VNTALLAKSFILIDYLCSTGGPVLYTGRDNKTSHKGMGITHSDWDIFVNHLKTTLTQFNVLESEQRDVLNFIESTKTDIVE